jgi:hypothetical protein
VAFISVRLILPLAPAASPPPLRDLVPLDVGKGGFISPSTRFSTKIPDDAPCSFEGAVEFEPVLWLLCLSDSMDCVSVD